MGRRKSNLKGLKKRWVINYLIVIVIAVLVIEIGFIIIIKKFYYNNVSQNLVNRVTMSTGFYNKYLHNKVILDHKVIKQIIEDFEYGKYAELQIVDIDGEILQSSSGIYPDIKIKTDDYIAALNGKIKVWIGKNGKYSEKVMAVSAPLKSEKDTLAILRYITSLETIDKYIGRLIVVSLIVLFIIVGVMFMLSMFFTRTVITPINEITQVSNKMAKGKFSERIKKLYDDEIGELSDTINYMASEISKNKELKNKFISSISHEIRTPLTSIRGWGETILAGGIDDKKQTLRGLNIIVEETKRLSTMVEQLLDFSKLDSGKITLYLEETDIREEIEKIIYIFKPRVQKFNIDIYYKCEHDIPIVDVDKDRIKQVFINILDNAVKFSKPNSKIYINLGMQGERIVIQIKDEGTGIPKEDLPKVLETFYKGTTKKSGSGLGLAISNEIMKLHGGKMQIESEVDKGTIVNLYFPINCTKQYI